MSKQRLVDAYEMLLNESEAYLSVQMSGKVSETTQMVNSVVHKKIQQLIADTPTIDPETLPIVQRLRTQIDAIKEAYSVAGHRPLLTQAIERFGQDAQERMMFEEMSELQKAMCKLSRGKGCIDDIAQEIADVEIMLEQMKILYQCEESTALWKHEKLERLRSLLNKGRDK